MAQSLIPIAGGETGATRLLLGESASPRGEDHDRLQNSAQAGISRPARLDRLIRLFFYENEGSEAVSSIVPTGFQRLEEAEVLCGCLHRLL